MLTAVITGVAGQDGSYLAEALLAKGYRVVGLTRRRGSHSEENLPLLVGRENFRVVYGDITDATLISRVLHDEKPHEYYNLAAHSHVGQSFAEPLVTLRTNGVAVSIALEAIRHFSPSTRFYQASTSELFGTSPCPETGHTEASPFHPRSPYGVAKLTGYWATVNAREAWGLHASNGILFNHSSPRRGVDFATRKITRGLAAIAAGKADCVRMGDLSAFRDEGQAADYMDAAWRMLQQDEPGDYVVGTGTGATIEQMFRHVCERAGVSFEAAYKTDPRFLRPSEVPFLKANPARAREVLGWTASYDWRDVLDQMFDADLAELSD
ncbi:MAG: GDP-mannose 4,6-dehydratase [Deltaproteobacteria bacterium]|nr:MAG: GDP-mannose 4,6-dehydratase [Deltaproteobacteria bacterium]